MIDPITTDLINTALEYSRIVSATLALLLVAGLLAIHWFCADASTDNNKRE